MAGEDVQVKFGAQLDGLIAGINSAKAQLEGITAPISGIKSAFAGLAEVAGAAFAVDKLLEFEDRYAELGEQIDRTSRILGESTEKVQLFSLAMKMAGGDADAAGMTLNILQKNIGDAISKAGPARAAFDNMGFSLERLKSTDIVTLLFEIKQRMDEAGSSAEQSALKQEYLRTVAGRQAAQFLALGLTFEQVKKIAEETGYVMSPGMVGKAKELSDSTHELSAAWTGLSNNIASDVAPAYKGLIDLTTKLIEGTNSLLGGVKKPKGPSAWDEQDQFERDLSGNAGVKLGKGQFGPNPDTNPLPTLDTGADKGGKGKEAKDDTAALYRQDIADEMQLDRTKLEAKKALLQEEVDAGQITNAQKLAALRQFADQEYGIQLSALQAEENVGSLSEAQWNKIQDQKLLIAAQHDAAIEKLNLQSVLEQKKQYDQLFTGIKSAMDGMVSGILQGTQTLTQALARMVDNIGVKFAQMAANDLLDWTRKQLLKVAVHQTANDQIAAADAAAASAGNPVGAAKMIKEIESSAATTYAGVFAFLSPEMGPFAAVPAGVSAAAVGAMTGLVSLDVGAWEVPQNMPAYLHAGEMVVPQNFASGLRDGGGIGGGGGDQYSVTIHAVDAQSFANLLQSTAGQRVLVNTIAQQSRNMNPKVTGSLRT